MRRFGVYLFRIALWVIAIVLAINVAILIYADQYLVPVDHVPQTNYGMILGASVYRDGSLSDVLRQRVDAAIEVYNQEWFTYFFVSWDDSDGHGEVRAIVAYLHSKWIGDEAIITDPAWFDTYDSIRRAKEVYKIDGLLIFTQDFHLSRSVYIAKRLDIEAYWVVIGKQSTLKMRYLLLREIGARVKAFLDVEILHSQAKYGV